MWINRLEYCILIYISSVLKAILLFQCLFVTSFAMVNFKIRTRKYLVTRKRTVGLNIHQVTILGSLDFSVSYPWSNRKVGSNSADIS